LTGRGCAGQTIVEDARALVAALPLTDVEKQRRPGLPVLQFQANAYCAGGASAGV
jgi:hypothetical protein